MVVGHGDIASAIIDRPDLLFFASGVSNSGETRVSEFARELSLLKAQEGPAHLVYFSSMCVFYADTPYADHKRNMEEEVKEMFYSSTIVRLGTITWGVNHRLLINHLRARHLLGLPLDIQPVQRVVHTLADFHYALSLIPAWPCEMPVPGRLMTVQQIVAEFVMWDAVPT